MIVLSFDIGIKNLAYSVCEFRDHTLYRVHDTGVVNLISNLNTTQECENPMCKNKPNHRIGTGDSKLILCGTKRCAKWATNTWSQLFPKSKATIQKFKQKKATQYSLIEIASAMKQWILQKQSEWKESNCIIDDILLEHQPVFRNPVMKSVEMILVGVIIGTGFHTNIHFVHAKRKTSTQNSYGERKQASIDIIVQAMKDTPDVFPDSIRDIWNNSRKRDDIADTITQAIAFVTIT